MLRITTSEAREFYDSLCQKRQGLMTAEVIAYEMEMSVEDVMQYCFAMVYYGITIKQGDNYVI